MTQDHVDSEVNDNIPESPTDHSKFDRSTFLTQKLKQGTKRLLHLNEDSERFPAEDPDCEASEIFEDAAYDPHRILAAHQQDDESFRNKLHRGAHSVAVTLKNPRRAARSKYARVVARNIAGNPETYEGRHDEELLDAHDALNRAKTRANLEEQSDLEWSGSEDLTDSESNRGIFDSLSGSGNTAAEDVEDAQADVHRVEAKHESLKIAWILGRHVKRIRVARTMVKSPTRSDFLRVSPDGTSQGIQWDRYLAQKGLWYTHSFAAHHIDDFDELPFNLKDLSLAMERLAIVSAPAQHLLLKVRSVYLWEDRKRTTQIMVLYWVLWYFNQLITAAVAGVIFVTIKNKLQPTRIDTIRKRLQRAENEQAQARAWGELIQKHGIEDWIEPLLDDMGPLLQTPLVDLANWLEILQNFYSWEEVHKTWSTLFFFFVCLLLSLSTDMNCCAKALGFGVGNFFFISLPLAAKYPKYRKVVNPLHWIFWNIPNMAELAIARLQEKAVLRDSARFKETKMAYSSADQRTAESITDGNEVSTVTPPKNDVNVVQAIRDNDQITFRAVRSGSKADGRLKLLRDGFFYNDKDLRSYYPYARLSEVRKMDITSANNPDASKTARLFSRIQKATSFEFLPAGIEFVFLTPEPNTEGRGPASQGNDHLTQAATEQLALTVSESDRDKILSVVISWSNLKWQPLFSFNERNRFSENAGGAAKTQKGNDAFDRAVKSFAH